MDRVQQNAGTAGIVTAICLAVLFGLFISSGLGPEAAMDPAKALPVLGEKAGVFAAIGVLGLLAAGFGLLFTIGLFARLRDRAPTRAATLLGLALVGLIAHGAGSALLWQGGHYLVRVSATDQTAASHAWIAITAVWQGINTQGNAFTGASILIAGWAVIATGAMSATVGWVGVIAGVLQIAQVFSSAQALMGLGFLFTIVWLAWAGSQLRRAPA